jgi:hypothetical protein
MVTLFHLRMKNPRPRGSKLPSKPSSGVGIFSNSAGEPAAIYHYCAALIKRAEPRWDGLYSP